MHQKPTKVMQMYMCTYIHIHCIHTQTYTSHLSDMLYILTVIKYSDHSPFIMPLIVLKTTALFQAGLESMDSL